nr:unnamed protein product [Callosobruchus analis]
MCIYSNFQKTRTFVKSGCGQSIVKISKYRITLWYVIFTLQKRIFYIRHLK